MPVDVAARKAKIDAKRRRRAEAAGIDWNLTNIGAALCLMGFFLFIFIFLNYLMTATILLILSIPGAVLIIIGYILIVKDYFDNQKIPKARRKRRTSTEEE